MPCGALTLEGSSPLFYLFNDEEDTATIYVNGEPMEVSAEDYYWLTCDEDDDAEVDEVLVHGKFVKASNIRIDLSINPSKKAIEVREYVTRPL